MHLKTLWHRRSTTRSRVVVVDAPRPAAGERWRSTSPRWRDDRFADPWPDKG